ncbi:leucyl aminopeptidase [Palleronia salina]|uniref:Leucyl aminopeptidase n=1 Tax=Palleronia salina TaxID=313368 RepID=A0A1M6DF08_9RHOB|nr:leucyl aminopeptidase family protein [Palleronia salina]SHI71661.1 leucyl aminopeptidase [Palleronia salina]
MPDLSDGFAPADADARPLWVLGPDDLKAWRADQPAHVGNWLDKAGFAAQAGRVIVVPSKTGGVHGAVLGLGEAGQRDRHRFLVGGARASLPEGDWQLAGNLDPDAAAEAALGWLLAGYAFGRYAKAPSPAARLVPPTAVDADRIAAIAAGEALTRDLINTPANDMGPAELESAARDLATAFGAGITVTAGDALKDANFPLIHTVGRAAAPHRAPRLIEMTWGDTGPRLTLVGKGVCFDTGGLNLKPGASMGLMKKDMGGAATVLGLARMIMALKLPLRLRVLVPAVENAVGSDAFRPGDILTARDGKTVEINNTDAEGRLVLADALALAAEEASDLTVSMATLTGAARVAVGPDLAPFFCDDDGIAAAFAAGGAAARDPVWRMPFWAPYEQMIEPGIADLDNAPKGGFAGAITAALFLRRFAGDGTRYAHFDIYGWQPQSAPARPKGGVGQGARAILAALPGVLGL